MLYTVISFEPSMVMCVDMAMYLCAASSSFSVQGRIQLQINLAEPRKQLPSQGRVSVSCDQSIGDGFKHEIYFPC